MMAWWADRCAEMQAEIVVRLRASSTSPNNLATRPTDLTRLRVTCVDLVAHFDPLGGVRRAAA
jgi:hypothetical protein